MPSFRVNFKKTTRLEDAEFSLSEKENEGAGRSFFVSILENEGAVEKGAFSKERSSTVEGETAAQALIRHRESAAWHTEMVAHLEVCSMSWAGPVTRSRARARPY